jgi:hypothetical protein
VLHPQIKLDSVLSQVYIASINVPIKFQMRVVERLNLSAVGHSTSVHANSYATSLDYCGMGDCTQNFFEHCTWIPVDVFMQFSYRFSGLVFKCFVHLESCFGEHA